MRSVIPTLLGIIIVGMFPITAVSQDGNEPTPPRAADSASLTTYGRVTNLLAYENDGDQFYFRVDDMPKGIDWFRSKSAKTFAVAQQAASEHWVVRVWHNEKGDIYFVKSIIDHVASPPKDLASLSSHLDAVMKVKSFIEQAKGSYTIVRANGPSGNIYADITTSCGKTYPIAQVVTLGIDMAIAGKVGTGDTADPNAYEYILFIRVTDSKGKAVLEGTNRTTTKNVQFPPEFGYIAHHPATCPELGDHKVEVFLFSVLQTGQLTLLDRKECKYTVSQK